MINVNQALKTHEIIINKLGGPYGLEYITTPRRLIWLFYNLKIADLNQLGSAFNFSSSRIKSFFKNISFISTIKKW
jgi:hypothetical protein